MSFGDATLETILPPYLTDIDKNRLKEGLAQFLDTAHRQTPKRYDYFYLDNPPPFFMQGDLIHSLPVYDWNFDNNEYSTGFSSVMLVSNSCDVSPKEDRLLEKEALFAIVVPLENYFSELREDGYTEDNITSIYSGLTHQTYTNLFYLPHNPIDHQEFIVFFDKVFWHPSENFQKKLAALGTERFISLDNFGFYLFLCKLSYHFCRIPEESERISLQV